jgi:ketosteroid isomerase-like protein
MRLVTLAAVVCLGLVATAGAQTADADVLAPITRFVDRFNKGDGAGAAATHAAGADLTIVDEVAPYIWRGPKAFQEWSAALDSDAKKTGMTEPKVTLSAPTRIEKAGDQAYVVVPAVFTFKSAGKAMRESAQMTFVLKKGAGAGAWLIHSWTWTGPRPHAVAPSKK